MAAEAGPAPAGSRGVRRDGLWLLVIWIVLSIIGCLLVALVWGPHLPPGAMSNTAASQQVDYTVLGVIATPVVIGVLLYFGWALAFWRQKPGDETDAAPIHGNTRIQATWITVTSAIVLALAVYGTVELIAPAGAGAGQGPQPIFTRGMPPAASDTSWAPGTNSILQVQVIGQQWAWTYRYPQFGGFETTELLLPLNTPVRFNVTSLDVIHSFWAYQLGVKADANPGVNNIAFVTAKNTGKFVVRCNELCGLWHGAMVNYGQVVSMSAFKAWATRTEAQLAPITAQLPAYATVYDPTVIPQINKAMAKAGIAGANGYYYPPNDPVQP